MASKKKKEWGGKRPNSGRKELAPGEKRKPITVYIREKTIFKEGGEAAIKKKIVGLVDKD